MTKKQGYKIFKSYPFLFMKKKRNNRVFDCNCNKRNNLTLFTLKWSKTVEKRPGTLEGPVHGMSQVKQRCWLVMQNLQGKRPAYTYSKIFSTPPPPLGRRESWEEKNLDTFQAVPNCYRTPIPTFHSLKCCFLGWHIFWLGRAQNICHKQMTHLLLVNSVPCVCIGWVGGIVVYCTYIWSITPAGKKLPPPSHRIERWQNGKLWCLYRLHLKVALPHSKIMF